MNCVDQVALVCQQNSIEPIAIAIRPIHAQGSAGVCDIVDEEATPLELIVQRVHQPVRCLIDQHSGGTGHPASLAKFKRGSRPRAAVDRRNVQLILPSIAVFACCLIVQRTPSADKFAMAAAAAQSLSGRPAAAAAAPEPIMSLTATGAGGWHGAATATVGGHTHQSSAWSLVRWFSAPAAAQHCGALRQRVDGALDRVVSNVAAPRFDDEQLMGHYLSTPFAEREFHQSHQCHCALQFGQCVQRQLLQPAAAPPPPSYAVATSAAAASISTDFGRQFRRSLQVPRLHRESSLSHRVPDDASLQHWVHLRLQEAQALMAEMRTGHESRRRQRGGHDPPHLRPSAADAALPADLPTDGSVASGLPKRHPLLNSTVSAMFQTLPSIYQSGPIATLGIDVELRVDVDMSRRNLNAPIQLALHALRPFQQDEEVLFYGGIPLHNDLIRRVGQEMKLPFACSHARSINNIDFSFDGLPFAWMIHRPVPGTEARLLDIANRGVACLLPHLRDGYTAAEKRAFANSPLGYMVNCAGEGQTNNLKIKWRKVGGLYEIPVLTARCSIEPGDQLRCPYNNEEQRQWIAAERNIGLTAAAPVRTFSTAPQRTPSRVQSTALQRQQRKQAVIGPLNAKLRQAAAAMPDVDEEATTEPDDDDGGSGGNFSDSAAADAFRASTREFCDVCHCFSSSQQNPIICCGVKGCLQGRHRDCWSGEKPPLDSAGRRLISHRCYIHWTPRFARPRHATVAPADHLQPTLCCKRSRAAADSSAVAVQPSAKQRRLERGSGSPPRSAWSTALAGVMSAVAAPVRRLSAYMRGEPVQLDTPDREQLDLEPRAEATDPDLQLVSQRAAAAASTGAMAEAADAWLHIDDDAAPEHDAMALRLSLVEEVVEGVARSVLLNKKTSKKSSLQLAAILNNIYLFDLHQHESPRRISAAIAEQLALLIQANQRQLEQHYNLSMEQADGGDERGLFDRQQQQQYRVVYIACPAGATARPDPVTAEDLTSVWNSLADFCVDCEDVPPQSDPSFQFGDWKGQYVSSFAGLFDSLSSIVCFISIDAGHVDDPRLASVCQQIDPLWEALIKNNLCQRWAALTGNGAATNVSTRCFSWRRLLSSILYLATHCIFAQTLYQTRCVKPVDEIVGYANIARLLAEEEIVNKLIEWQHAELLTEIIAVSKSQFTHAAGSARLRR